MTLCDVRDGMDNVLLKINSLIGPKEVSFLCNHKRGEMELCLSFDRRSKEVNHCLKVCVEILEVLSFL